MPKQIKDRKPVGKRRRARVATVRGVVADASTAVLSQFHRELFEGIHGFSIYATDLRGRVIYWPGSAKRLYGYSAKETLGKTTTRFLPADEAEAMDGPARLRLALDRKRYELTGWRLRKNRRPFWARIIATPLTSADGTVVGGTIITQDLTEQSRAEREAMHLAAIVESSADAIISTNLAGIVQTWNNAAERLLGYSRAQIVGHSISILIPPERSSERQETLELIRSGKDTRYYETVRLRRDGLRVPVQVTLSPVRDKTGRIVGASKVLHDTSKRQRTEAQLRDSESRFRVTYEYAPIGIEQVALSNGRLLDVNRKLCQMLGYKRDDLLGHRFSDITHPADRGAERKLLRSLLNDEAPSYTVEKRYLHKNGSPVWVRVTSAKAGGHADRPYRISIIEDITQQKLMQRSLEQSEQHMRAIVTTAADAVITINSSGLIQSVNPATTRMFGYHESELLGRNADVLLPEAFASNHVPASREYVQSARGRVSRTGRDTVGLRNDGTGFPVHVSVSDVRLDSERMIIAIVHDLSERRRLENQILEAGANEQRRIGHDLHDGLCQELVGISYTSEMLARQLQTRSADEAALARNLGDSMRHVVAEARQLAHGLNPVDVRAGGLRAGLGSLARRISETFNVACVMRCDGPSAVKDDLVATHLYRIAQEAISNAIKHGKADQIEVSLRQANAEIELAVADNGRGISKKVLSRLQHVEDGAPAGNGAYGMGLQTMMYRARFIGGKLIVERRQPRGTLVMCRVKRIGSDAAASEPI